VINQDPVVCKQRVFFYTSSEWTADDKKGIQKF